MSEYWHSYLRCCVGGQEGEIAFIYHPRKATFRCFGLTLCVGKNVPVWAVSIGVLGFDFSLRFAALAHNHSGNVHALHLHALSVLSVGVALTPSFFPSPLALPALLCSLD